MSQANSRNWAPITDLPEGLEKSLTNQQTAALVQAWQEQAGDLRNQDLYKDFLGKLQRQWAIETGVIEGLYSISEGATTALIEKGLDAALISHSDTSDSPENVIAKINDQHSAILGLYDFISGSRQLSISYMRELHSVLTQHQPTYTGRDTLGNVVTRDLPRGDWKKLKNNVEHPDGAVFEYCPPEHVDQEMEALLAIHRKHVEQGVPPDIEAAWLHHRFTLIHPFTDGNGRVARCLATLVLLKAHWLPLVITRHDRSAYISALRAADANDLRPLVDVFCSLQRKAIREALSLSEQVIHDATAIHGVLTAVKAKFSKRRSEISALIQAAFNTADLLQVLTRHRLEEVASEVDFAIRAEGSQFAAYVYYGERGSDKAKFNYHQIIDCARALNYYANLPHYQSWAALAIRTEIRTEILFSFHGIGQEATGVLGCSAMAYTKERTEDDDTVVSNFTPLADAPFEFTYLEDSTDVRQRFKHWLDEKVLKGLEIWENVL